jgi:hypothetical protein
MHKQLYYISAIECMISGVPCPDTLDSVNTGVMRSEQMESAAICTLAMSFTGKGIFPLARRTFARAVRVVFKMFSGQIST